MDEPMIWQLVRRFALVSVLAFGGANAATPEIHRFVVDQLGWMNNSVFANLYAIAQAAPGPNVMFISIIGWHMAGLSGLIAATLAMNVPSSILAFGIGRVVAGMSASRWVTILRAGLAPIAVALLLANGVVMASAAYQTLLDGALTLLAALFVFYSRNNPLWALLAAVILRVGVAHLTA
ncbi:chromate transporter [Methylovirgula sp. 4M-Z18]|uniref:chromate transporter n=1 Tax=Methylovirgula sp. 4M-Z18 TaxID=2293567 RepID=UPI000E2F4660|nr:chromate transporter [Methylovirgula sp. 4M-Z18]RFB79671.1 chromate transporter [Methylovirgula sp. 4M-Z18]